MSTLLVIDDDRSVRHIIEQTFADGDIHVLSEGNADAGKLMAFSVDHYIEAEDYMMMRSNVLSENTLTKACDTYYFHGDKVFLFAAQTKAKNWDHLTKEWALRWMF